MSNMKCPICQTILDKALLSDKVRGCPKCKNIGNIDLWQELIRTRKALDVARIGLEYIFGYECVPEYVVKHIRQVLDQIKNETALEQKDK